MHNALRGQAELELGGKDRVLQVDFNTLAMIEESTGVTFIYDTEDAEKRAEFERKSSTLSFVRKAVAAALSSDKRVVSPSQVGVWFSEDPGKIVEATRAFKNATQSFFEALAARDKRRPTAEVPAKTQGEGGTSDGQT